MKDKKAQGMLTVKVPGLAAPLEAFGDWKDGPPFVYLAGQRVRLRNDCEPCYSAFVGRVLVVHSTCPGRCSHRPDQDGTFVHLDDAEGAMVLNHVAVKNLEPVS